MEIFWNDLWNERRRLSISDSNGLVRCEAAWCWNASEFKDFDLWICLDGSGEMSINGTRYPITRGFSVCFPPGNHIVEAVHDPENPLQVFFCHFSLEGVPVSTLSALPAPVPKDIIVDPLLWNTVNELITHLEYLRNPSLEETLLWQLLIRRESRSTPPADVPEERVRLLIRQIREAPADTHTVEELARTCGLSTGHFRRIFKRMTGTAPLQFILHRRIERARYFLTQTRLSISHIAETVGYRDVYFFSRQFKERTGISPSRYRSLN